MLSGTFYSRNKAKILQYEKERHASLTDHQRENLKAYQALYYACRKKKQQIERMEPKEELIKKVKQIKEKPKKEPKITLKTTKRVYKKKEKPIPQSYKYETGVFVLTFD
jgi:hypothetical protein